MRQLIGALVAGVAVVGGGLGPALGQEIRYEKYQLPNGMTVILHEDHALPSVTIDTWFRVGAKDEPPGRSGFAHLFEHLMFMGTQRVPGNDFDRLMEAGGGANNASTSLDRTNYYSTGPGSLLPTLLWLDADRLEDLGRAMDSDKLRKQQDVVRNEIRQQVENTPYGRADESMYRLMYPQGHPYHNAVYGTHEDLEAADVWNVKDFFATYYVPNNASLVVAGDFDPAQIKPLVQRLFGTLPAGAPVEHRAAPVPRLEHEVRATMLDKVQLPLIRRVWHSPAYYGEGDAEMDLAGAVLSQGKNSRLYQRLVMQDKVAVEVSARQESAALSSLFIVDVLCRPGADLAAVERTVDAELERLATEGPAPRELEERRATMELAKLAELQSLRNVADKLNEYEYYFHEPDSFKRDLDRYRSATPERVRDWAARVLDPRGRAVIHVLPEEPAREATPRDTRPRDLPPADFSPQEPVRFELSGGVPVMLWQKEDLPLVATTVLFTPGGPLADPAHAGLPTLAASMLDEGAGDLDATAFAGALQLLGAHLSASAGAESAAVSLTVLKRNYDRAAGLMADAIRRPRMQEDDWERVKRVHLENLRQEDEEPTVVASRVGVRELFGAGNPYGWPTEGTVATVSPLKLEDVSAEHDRLFRPEFATILVAGDISPDEARASLEKAFAQWVRERSGSKPDQSAALEARPGSGLRVYIVDRPEAVQTVIRFITPGPRYQNERRPALRLLNTVLGGSFTSRLNQNLREKHGYTYGAGSRFNMMPSAGYFVASASVKADTTGAALKEFLAEFDRLRSGTVTAEEAGKARETIKADTVQEFAGLSGLLGAAAEPLAAGAPFATIGQDLKAMENVSEKELNGLAKAAMPIETGVLVLVGDRRLIMEQTKDLGLPAPSVVDAQGEPVKAGG
jgi:predicted Zn-dependent peptidase